MFYSQFILAKKGPLGTIWIAAHLERKLRKNQVADTDIGVSVDSILFPEVPIALRLSSHLLLGVVRIYSRKVNYLFDDCSEALLKVKQAFRSTAVDLPPEESTAPYHSITLPETFDLDDFELPDNDIFQGNYVDHHVSTREQITLQDTMEGVVYSTSQFGLDERFGDGDASQIGLDLDEVLLADKAATLEHDDRGASSLVSHPKDETKEEIDGLSSAAEVHEYAEGPSTPGLEEPNFYGTPVDQVNNEAEFHNSADFVSTENTQKVPAAQQTENDVTDCSLQNNVKQFDVDLHHGDGDSTMVELDSKREVQEPLIESDSRRDEQEQMACVDQENLIPNDHCLTSLPLMVSSNKEDLTTPVPECADGMISASDIPEKVEELHEVLMNNETTVAPLDQTVTKGGVSSGGVGIHETAGSPSCPHVASDQEDLPCKHLSNTDGSHGPVSDGHLEDDPTLSKNEVQIVTEISQNEGKSCPLDEAQVSCVTSALGSPNRPQAVNMDAQVSQEFEEAEAFIHATHEVVLPTESHLRPCTSHLSQLFSSAEAEKCHEADISDPALVHQETADPSACRGSLDLGKLDLQLGSEIFSDKAESMNNSVAEMPEPEKMLSIAYQHDGRTNDLMMQSTPDNHGISDGHTGAAGVTGISGKKRSFTESTITVQSVDFVESYGGAQSKRTVGSIPDDDDLLSSILVGRRSSVLKMKPSPAAPEIASMKRPRATPRTTASKRKVHMDDTMVLHGDTIRQQLTDTEDIRRLRKKAPCTRHEIAMIQRQFLEDAIFHESIFTGLSSDLIILRNETFDLTGIKVCDDDSSVIEKANDQESYSRTNTEIHGLEGSIEPMAVQLQGVAEVQPTEIPVLSENHQSEYNLGSHDIDALGSTDNISHVKELESSQNAEGRNIEVSEAENYPVVPGHESSSLTEVLENDLGMPNDFVAPMPPMDQTNDLVGSVHTDVSSIPTADNLNAVPILEDEFVEDKGDRSGVVANEMAEHSVEIGEQVHTDGLGNNLYATVATDLKETDEYTNNQASVNGDQRVEENGNSMLGGVDEHQMVVSDLGCDDKDKGSGCILIENGKVDGLHSAALVSDEKENYLNYEENPVCQEVGLQSTTCLEIPAIGSPFVDLNDENVMVNDDTGFLNVGDDEMIEEEDDDYITEGTHLENSGWSSRTRAVAKYLQTLFDKEELHGRQELHLDNVLAGKTRKEASRMFFETLVLKTRDYVHVEQPKPFASINIKPRMKLMKSDF